MAPEHPPELVIFDARFEEKKLVGDLHYIEVPIGHRLRVRWDAESEAEDFQPIGGGVASVFKTDQLQVLPLSRDSIPDDLGDLSYRWSEGLNLGVPWMMFVLILPTGYTLAAAKPRPARAKIFKDRLALYWILKGDDLGRTQVVCTLSAFEADTLSTLVELNRFCSEENPPPNSPIQIEQRLVSGLGTQQALSNSTPTKAGGKRQLVILLHGIRTRAEWQGRIRHLLEADGRTVVEALGYGYFDVFRFLCPFFTRRGPINEVLAKIRDAFNLQRNREPEVIFVGHSFGTYILGTILSENPDIKPDRVLLCGSILSRTYRWDKLPNRPRLVLNEVGSRDIWPILAKSITWNYGSTGTFGFQTPGVRDRYHNLAHSDYFKPGFAEEYWVPWIRDGAEKQTAYEISDRPSTPFFKNLLEIVPLKWVIIFLLLASFLLYLAAPLVSPSKPFVLHAEAKKHLERIEERLSLHLNAEMLKLNNPPKIGYDPMAVAQIRVALGRAASVSDQEVIRFLAGSRDENGAWHHPSVPNHTHLGATAWVIYCYAMCHEAVPVDTLEFVLSQQGKDGWWPMVAFASDSETNASTYATAWIVLALSEQLKDNLVSSIMRNETDRAIRLATGWLEKTETTVSAGCLDYPYAQPGSRVDLDGETRNKITMSVSGLLLFCLGSETDMRLSRMSQHREWLNRIPRNLPLPNESGDSNYWLTLADGERLPDHFRHYVFPWVLVGISKAFADGAPADQ